MYDYLILSQLGELFGVKARKIGEWLTQMGLRTRNRNGRLAPSRTAHRDGFVRREPCQHGSGYYHSWNRELTVRALEDAGHVRVREFVSGEQDQFAPACEDPHCVEANGMHLQRLEPAKSTCGEGVRDKRCPNERSAI